MPIYEYKCDKCDKVFEVRQKFSDEPLTTHEECGGTVHRLLSAPAFQFKGSGWYVTDYARSSNKKESKDSPTGAAKDKSESHSEVKSDSNGSTASGSESKSSKSETSTKSDTKSDSSTK